MEFKALLIQIRQNEKVLIEERNSFAEASGLSLEQVHTFNVFNHQSFDHHLISPYKCLFIGGASEASVLKPQIYTFMDSLKNLINHCVQHDFPVFASCFGFQAAVLALGGEIERDEVDFEMGTYPMQLTKAAKGDPIYYNMPDDFEAVSVHQEKCVRMPNNCELLAFTDSCPHSFRVLGKPFWAFQFHPELSKKNLVARLAEYQTQYIESADHYQKIIDSLNETPEAPKLLQNFISYVKNI